MTNRRFEMYEYRQVLHQMRLGASDRQIARRGLMGRSKAKTVRAAALARGWLERGSPLPEDAELCEAFRPLRRRSSVSSVEPYGELVTGWHREGIQATTIHDALVRLKGFGGSYSAVRRFIQSLEPCPDVTVPLRFEPGEAAQVDFGRGPDLPARGGGVIKTWFFVMTLCWSRHQYAEIVLDQRVETWLSCHIHAFEFFGGVPRQVTVDNAKCAITKACRTDPEVQRATAELAEGYGFLLDPCPPREPQLKGRVESGVGYLKKAFLPLREFRDLTNSNRQLWEWILGQAGNRTHGTTREKPLTRFRETEQGLLQPLPTRRVEPAAWRRVKVARDCHAQYEQCRYSVPYGHVGQSLWLRAAPSTIQLFSGTEMVATHARLSTPRERGTVLDHLPPEARAVLERTPEWCRDRAREIGPSCLGLVEALQGDRVSVRHRAVQGIVRLGERFGEARLEAACRRALAFEHLQYRAVKTILENGLDTIEDEEPAFDRLSDAYLGKGRFCRDLKNLLIH